MKMKKSLVALCLSAGLLASVPAVTFLMLNVPQNTSAAPSIPAAALSS
jgi:maltose operon protein